MITPISQAQMVAMMLALRGATFVTFVSVTEPTFAKTDDNGNPSPFRTGDIVKVANVNATINFIYENAVNRQRIREELEADFQAFPRKWGHRVWDGDRLTPIIEHTNKEGEHKFYIEAKPERSLGHEYRDRDNNVVANELVEPFIRRSGTSRQGTEKEIYVRDYSLSNIRAITLKGQQYALVG
jgi:hypothetical protein